MLMFFFGFQIKLKSCLQTDHCPKCTSNVLYETTPVAFHTNGQYVKSIAMEYKLPFFSPTFHMFLYCFINSYGLFSRPET